MAGRNSSMFRPSIAGPEMGPENCGKHAIVIESRLSMC